MDTLFQIDTQIFYIFNGLIGQSYVIDALVLFCAQYLIYIIIAIVILDIARRDAFSVWQFPHDIGHLAVTLAGSYGINEMLRTLIGRVRPLWALNTPYLFVHYTPSFPSGHTAFAFALGTFLFFFGEKRLARVVYILGVFVGLGRISAGVHYPIDILGGIILGILTGYCAHRFFGPKKTAL
jgi:undecaprenyl-diphosphatase